MGAVIACRPQAVLLLYALLLFIHTALPSAADLTASDNSLSNQTLGSDCRGSIGLCLLEEEMESGEFGMESESTRRMLAAARYISYGALRRNSIPCSRRGASYYNCRHGAHANPYSRGCSRITRCRS